MNILEQLFGIMPGSLDASNTARPNMFGSLSAGVQAQPQPQPQPRPARPAAPDVNPFPTSRSLSQHLMDFGSALEGNDVPDRAKEAELKNQTYQALVRKGLSADDAKLAVMNPTVLQTILPTVFGPKQSGTVQEIYDPQSGQPMKVLLKADGSYTPLGGVQKKTTTGEQTPGERAILADQYGLQGDQRTTFILTGKMPREDQQSLTATDKKAILEADDKVATNQNVLNALGEAEKLNPQAYSGFGAGVRSWLGNNLPDMAVPDVIASPERSAATSNLDNAIMTQALTQLKAIFGGNPTEGERAVLLELQGSSSKPADVRASIFKRARDLASARLAMNQREADQLRGGTYYKPGGGTSGGAINAGAAPGTTQPNTPEATKTINGKTYLKVNGQWYAQ